MNEPAFPASGWRDKPMHMQCNHNNKHKSVHTEHAYHIQHHCCVYELHYTVIKWSKYYYITDMNASNNC